MNDALLECKMEIKNQVIVAGDASGKVPAVFGRSSSSGIGNSFESCRDNLSFSSNRETSLSEYESSNPVRTVSLMAFAFRFFSPNAIAVRRSSWSSSFNASSRTVSDDSSFFRYARSVRQACSVAIFNVPNSLKFPVLLVLPRESSEASEGRLISLAFGLGGLRDRLRTVRRIPESSEAELKCFEFTVGTGGANVGDCVDRPYLDVFLRTALGGERLPVGVERGEARWNSANSALDKTLLSGGRLDAVSLGGDGSRLIALSTGSWNSGALGERSQIIIVPSAPVLMRVF